MDLSWTIPILKTWSHIIFGIGVIAAFIGVIYLVGEWLRSIHKQIEQRKSGKVYDDTKKAWNASKDLADELSEGFD